MTTGEQRARYVKPGEALALVSTRLYQDRKGFFWMTGSGNKPNERRGDVAIVHVRGELEHHKDSWGSESYEGIVEKFRAAYTGQDSVDAHEREHRYDDNYAPIEASAPEKIVMCLDSPGGVISGLNETVSVLQRMRDEHPDIEVSCYVDEMACSAAYALACSCDEIVCPPSAIIGSIGVISTMVSAEGADKKAGYDVRLIASGVRKADGHMHAPLTDGAIAAETGRVEKLAMAFFRLAGKARNLSVNKIRDLQAGVFLGRDAIRVGLADDVASFDDFMAGSGSTQAPEAGGNQTDRRVKGKRMTLSALLRKLVAEGDPKKRKALTDQLAGSISASLSAGYKKTRHVEHTEEEDDGDDEDDEKKDKDDEDDEDDEKSKAEGDDEGSDAKSAEDEKSAKSAESDEEDEEEESKKALALVRRLTGMRGAHARGALHALASMAAQTAVDVADLKRRTAGAEKTQLIDGARGKYLTKSEATWLREQPMAVVKGFVDMRKKAGVIVHMDESTIVKPNAAAPGTEESLPAGVLEMIDQALVGATGDKSKLRAELVAAHLESHKQQIRTATNGAGRY